MQGHINLLQTSVSEIYKGPPTAERLKTFIKQHYTFRQLVPASKWLPAYLGDGPGSWRENLYGDLSAGFTTAAFVVPQGMSYALVANLDPIYG